MSLMYEVDGTRVRTWNVFKGCNFGCLYCVQRDQAKRQEHRCSDCYNFVPHPHSERLHEKFHAGETVFVAAAGDISFATRDQWDDIMAVIKDNPKTTFILQSKNPQCFLREISYPDNVVLGTTIETNRDTYEYSRAPAPIYRYEAMLDIEHREYVTIEPILDFDLNILLKWVAEIKPEFVYVGYANPLWKAKKLKLPEPSLEDTELLIAKLSGITEVRVKTLRKGWCEQ